MTYYMEKSNKGEIPIIFPHSKVSSKEYNNFSEKNRFEKLSDQFMKLKQYIVNDELNEKFYLKEFMMKNGIYEEKYYTIDKLTNFGNFLFSDMEIDTSKAIKEIIIDATQYGPDQKIFHKKGPQNRTTSKCRPVTSDDKPDFSANFRDLNNSILDKRIREKINNPKALINSLENELAGAFNDEVYIPYNKSKRSNKVLELDFGNTYQKKKDKIEQVKKKHKLLEYVVLERSKNNILS
jgi:hypothetical protein